MISLLAGEERKTKRERFGDPLQVLNKHIDFAALAKAVDAKLVIGDSGRGGRPPYPTELMIRLLVLQQLYDLSDDALECQVLDRSSFQRFAGLEHSGRVPDAKTLWVWREQRDAPGATAASWRAACMSNRPPGGGLHVRYGRSFQSERGAT